MTDQVESPRTSNHRTTTEEFTASLADEGRREFVRDNAVALLTDAHRLIDRQQAEITAALQAKDSLRSELHTTRQRVKELEAGLRDVRGLPKCGPGAGSLSEAQVIARRTLEGTWLQPSTQEES